MKFIHEMSNYSTAVQYSVRDVYVPKFLILIITTTCTQQFIKETNVLSVKTFSPFPLFSSLSESFFISKCLFGFFFELSPLSLFSFFLAGLFFFWGGFLPKGSKSIGLRSSHQLPSTRGLVSLQCWWLCWLCRPAAIDRQSIPRPR